MKEKTIRVLKVEPHKQPEIVSLENNLTALQEAVSIGAGYRGLIELIGLTREVCILGNEEAKLIGLEPNRRLGQDILCGVFYVTGQNKSGDLTSLPESAMRYYSELFKEPEDISESEVVKTMVTRFFFC